MNEIIQLKEQLEPSIQKSINLMEKSYLYELDNYNVISVENEETIATAAFRKQIRLFEIEKIVYDKTEDTIEKLVNVYNTLGNLNNSLILVIDSDGNEFNFYLGTRTKNSSIAQDSILKSLKGNFPGTKLTKIKNSTTTEIMDKIVDGNQSRIRRTVASVSGIPAFKDTEKEQFVQGLEKFLNAMQGEVFSTVMIADSITKDQSLMIKQGYENMYTSLAKFQKTDYTAGKNESQALAETLTEGFTDSINESIGQTQSYTNSSTKGLTESKTRGESSGLSANLILGINKGSNSSKSKSVNRAETFGDTKGKTTTLGKSSAITKNVGKSQTKTDGTTQTIQVHYEDKQVSELLKKIDIHLERLNSAADLGMWKYAAYFLADDEQTATVAATNYQSIIRGNESAIEGSAINVWNGEHVYNMPLRKSLRQLHHPQFSTNVTGLDVVSPVSLINTRELAIACGLPRKSINGLPVIETAEFGRNISYLSQIQSGETIELGHIHHMGETEEALVELDVKSLAMHTFITGSTGSGKSNTVYALLEELLKEQINFLVIEPAKGEYKNVFGGLENVQVFGTNPRKHELLRINPFYFHPNIHVLEHIERLIEIFNACWPMYAAMPAVLREAVEEIYRKSGWQLELSINVNNGVQYPTMQMLAETLPEVIEKSGYSEEVKSNYVGALVTRIKSLSTGLLSNVFVDNEIDNDLLFNKNCIVDLSLIGSAETKSIVMGILFMRLQEHRMATAEQMNVPLKHVTVLEEAHHLLRNTSATQGVEGSGMQGKSVEMITNGIAEMRTYGEGFIIVDQSPNLLDPSAIRNTNTKIILRLPDEGDRILVGASAGLNELQYNEITKLETGVAVVYQNNWLEPVLCKVHRFDNEKSYTHIDKVTQDFEKKRKNSTIFFNELFSNNLNLESFIPFIRENNKLNTNLKEEIIKEIIEGERISILTPKNEVKLGEFLASYIPISEVMAYSNTARNTDEFNKNFFKILSLYIGNCKYKERIQESLMIYYCYLNPSFYSFYKEWYEDNKKEVVL